MTFPGKRPSGRNTSIFTPTSHHPAPCATRKGGISGQQPHDATRLPSISSSGSCPAYLWFFMAGRGASRRAPCHSRPSCGVRKLAPAFARGCLLPRNIVYTVADCASLQQHGICSCLRRASARRKPPPLSSRARFSVLPHPHHGVAVPPSSTPTSPLASARYALPV